MSDRSAPTEGWRFWADQGGTFTDLVGLAPDGSLHTTKVLSQVANGQADAIARGMERIASTDPDISELRIGTTIGTNALLERRTARTALVITSGFADALNIGHQQRPDLFALHIHRPPPLCERVLEVAERLDAEGNVLLELDEAVARAGLAALRAEGVEAVAICLLHGWCNPQHELRLKEMAQQVGFAQVSVGHEVLPQIRLIGRGDTTCADAALAPVLAREFQPLRQRLERGGVRLQFMQSDGLLAEEKRFRGCDSVLSGPAGGVIGGIAVAQKYGLQSIIGCDMGGTSTDLWHFNSKDELERRSEVEIGDCSILTPTLNVHTIAIGGGSVLRRQKQRLRVGPHSAGAQPGPACYGRGGPATVTDANFCTGRLLAEFFPALFGADGQQQPDPHAALSALNALSDTDAAMTADAFLEVACDQVAAAIRRISLERGYDPADSALMCMGGATGQHACRIAERLEMRQILAHPMAGVLSALGVGMARQGGVRRRTLQLDLRSARAAAILRDEGAKLRQELVAELAGLKEADLDTCQRVFALYRGSDSPLQLAPDSPERLIAAFEREHLQRYGYARSGWPVLVETLEVEVRDRQAFSLPEGAEIAGQKAGAASSLPESASILSGGKRIEAAVLTVSAWGEERLCEPALIVHPQFTLVVEPGWSARRLQNDCVMLEKTRPARRRSSSSSDKQGIAAAAAAAADSPIQRAARLERFIGLFCHVAEKMGATLRQTADSVNIRERLDYSCALFNREGDLITNAPHIPVHIGSMAESVRALIRDKAEQKQPLRSGDFYASNDPYHGGTHLPDLTVITPITEGSGGDEETVRFFLAVRGHHAEIGGIEPGSMPAASTHVEQEGVLFRNLLIATEGIFQEDTIRASLADHKWPSRNPELNLRDLQAQVAACHAGALELTALTDRYGMDTSLYWAGQVLDSGEAAVRALVRQIQPGKAEKKMENGSVLRVNIVPDAIAGTLEVDFTGSSAASDDNFNAPFAVTRAAVLYVLRCLVPEDIPLNEGCMRPVRLTIPEGSILAAAPPSAVVAGNVETSQALCNLLFRALSSQAGSQGTMNNLTFGDDEFQYYETLAGGTGAGADFNGADTVHNHMTNSRLTDPEILENRFPIRLERLAVRPNSGGRGRHNGGNGMVRRIRFLKPVTCSLITSGRDAGGEGLEGGGDGKAGRNLRIRANGSEEILPACTTAHFDSGEALQLETPGGGGYGASN